MEEFTRLVSEQMITMDELLFIESEISRCQQLEQELKSLKAKTKLMQVQEEIECMQKELQEIKQIFEEKTESMLEKYFHLKEPV